MARRHIVTIATLISLLCFVYFVSKKTPSSHLDVDILTKYVAITQIKTQPPSVVNAMSYLPHWDNLPKNSGLAGESYNRNASYQQPSTSKYSQHSQNSNRTSSLKELTMVKDKGKCRKSYKRKHFLLLDFLKGRTGNAMFQVICLIVNALDRCMTPIIDTHNFYFRRSFDPIFDLWNVVVENMADNSTFRKWPKVLSEKVLQIHHNWTLQTRCRGYTNVIGYEDYIRSCIRIKKEFVQQSEIYIKHHFASRSTAAIHVRRTDQVNRFEEDSFGDLEWYEDYINTAMIYLKRKHSNVSFIFVTDDIEWCIEHFRGVDHVHFSPCSTVGCDMALITLCDHVVLTVGTFGESGAVLGIHESVIYSKAFIPSSFAKRQMALPSWIGI